jgi:hypothetical protein
LDFGVVRPLIDYISRPEIVSLVDSIVVCFGFLKLLLRFLVLSSKVFVGAQFDASSMR